MYLNFILFFNLNQIGIKKATYFMGELFCKFCKKKVGYRNHTDKVHLKNMTKENWHLKIIFILIYI
jgi:hypothetical protein